MYLKEETKKNIERIVGIPINTIQNLSLTDEIALVENKTGKKLTFSSDSGYGYSTGNPLIDRHRFCTMEDIDKKLDKMLFPHSYVWQKLKRFFKHRS